MVAQESHQHAAPQGFIRKWVFSLDHKVIGLQYYFLALTAVFVGMFLSLLMRIHLIWPTAILPLLGAIKPETYLSLVTMHGTIMVFFVLATAALNVLTKGLIGVVFPAAIIVLYLILTGNLKHLLRMRLLSSLAVLRSEERRVGNARR